jgi:hypothetical protein
MYSNTVTGLTLEVLVEVGFFAVVEGAGGQSGLEERVLDDVPL